jgi:hypothetical protein
MGCGQLWVRMLRTVLPLTVGIRDGAVQLVLTSCRCVGATAHQPPVAGGGRDTRGESEAGAAHTHLHAGDGLHRQGRRVVVAREHDGAHAQVVQQAHSLRRLLAHSVHAHEGRHHAAVHPQPAHGPCTSKTVTPSVSCRSCTKKNRTELPRSPAGEQGAYAQSLHGSGQWVWYRRELKGGVYLHPPSTPQPWVAVCSPHVGPSSRQWERVERGGVPPPAVHSAAMGGGVQPTCWPIFSAVGES